MVILGSAGSSEEECYFTYEVHVSSDWLGQTECAYVPGINHYQYACLDGCEALKTRLGKEGTGSSRQTYRKSNCYLLY